MEAWCPHTFAGFQKITREELVLSTYKCSLISNMELCSRMVFGNTILRSGFVLVGREFEERIQLRGALKLGLRLSRKAFSL